MSDITVSVSLPPLFSLSEKAVVQAFLNIHNIPLSPPNWFQEIIQHDPNQNYIVFDLSHYKEKKLVEYQHEFVVFSVRRRNQPDAPTILIKAQRSIWSRDTIPAKLGLWGPADDTLTILPPSTTFPQRDFKRIHNITWQANPPSLTRISFITLRVHRRMPNYRLLKTSCYAFACATTQVIHLVSNGINYPQPHQFLVRPSHFMDIVPAGVSSGRRVAERALTDCQDLAQSGPFQF